MALETALAYCCEAGWLGLQRGVAPTGKARRHQAPASGGRYAAAAATIYDGVNL